MNYTINLSARVEIAKRSKTNFSLFFFKIKGLTVNITIPRLHHIEDLLDALYPHVLSTISIVMTLFATNVLHPLASLTELMAGLRIVRVTVPAVVRKGDTVHLNCDYELEQPERLYSIKWYKGRREFYRYTPQANPTVQTFSSPSGVEVDVSHPIPHTPHHPSLLYFAPFWHPSSSPC